jgi:hypothetical protein
MNNNLILLGGNSPEHKSWIYEVETELGDLFERTYIHVYKHWEENKPLIDLEYEVQKLGDTVKELKNYVVFAKSAGCLVALKAVKDELLHPDKCVFVGLPFTWGEKNGYKCENWLKDYNVPTMFIQKSLDPADSFEKVKDLVTSHNVSNYDLREVPGDTHHYEDLTLLRELILSFLALNQPLL